MAALEPVLATLETLSEQILAMEKRIKVLGKEAYPETNALRQVTGVGAITSLTFVSNSALRGDVGDQLNLKKRLSAAHGCRTVKKTDMIHNGWLPKMEIDAQTYRVRADGQLLTCDPATVLPMAQKYFLF